MLVISSVHYQKPSLEVIVLEYKTPIKQTKSRKLHTTYNLLCLCVCHNYYFDKHVQVKQTMTSGFFFNRTTEQKTSINAQATLNFTVRRSKRRCKSQLQV